VYGILTIMLQARLNPKAMRIETLHPYSNWVLTWKTLWDAPIPIATRTWWYQIIHDIIPTTQRLHAIGISQADTCRLFTGNDTLLHRLVKCGDGPEQWAWMRGRMAANLRMDKNWIPDTWLIRPQLT
jgi:hypothetical protein